MLHDLITHDKSILISCVPEAQCGGLFNVRGSDDDFVCEDTSLTCCHEDQITEPQTEQCSKFASEGYR